jgi:hypothetical protein
MAAAAAKVPATDDVAAGELIDGAKGPTAADTWWVGATFGAVVGVVGVVADRFPDFTAFTLPFAFRPPCR